ncbi:MAG: pyruvate kinase [Deltaproteobacteria bacterium]|nr:pyruvate kinase [Deltaproteobacteria bacterium]
MSLSLYRKTKIICTIGPSTFTPEMVRELLLAGMDVVRFNFSHGSQEEHAKGIALVRAEAEKLGRQVAIIADLQGPKIRTNNFPNGAIELLDGTEVKIVHSQEDGAPGLITTKFDPLVRDSTIGDRILMNDGLIELVVERKDAEGLVCSVIHGGELKDRRGINLPFVKLDVSAMTDKDIADARFALAHDVDFIALSFVRSARDIFQLKDLIDQQTRPVQVIAKIEKPEAVEDLEQILHAADAVMVARGDLGVEMGIEKVPAVQKRIIREALCHGVPVITATQMLESMIVSPRPTRAEASDVANAVFDGTDAIMLSGETSVGKYPIDAVKIMVQIAEDAEKQEVFFNFDDWQILDSSSSKQGMSLGKSARLFAEDMQATALACLSDTGNAAIRLTSQRPQIPVYMFSTRLDSVRRMNLVRGAYAFWLQDSLPPGKVFPMMESLLVERGLIKAGDIVVYTAGISLNHAVTTNTIHIRTALRD